MNLNTITKSNSKGQIVIPKRFRDELGIEESVFLNISLKGNGLYITTLNKNGVSSDFRNMTLDILKKTAGAWSNDNWSETQKKRIKIEKKASKNRKKSW